MTGNLDLMSRERLPSEFDGLRQSFPRDMWDAHHNLGPTTQFWLRRHAFFRQLMARVTDMTDAINEGRLDAEGFATRGTPLLNQFLGNLHEHHMVEDQHYFPIFRAAVPEFGRGFDLLDADHHTLDAGIHASVEAANQIIRMTAQPTQDPRGSLDAFSTAMSGLIKGLNRHLEDEEDIIVPIILDRSEVKLGIS